MSSACNHKRSQPRAVGPTLPVPAASAKVPTAGSPSRTPRAQRKDPCKTAVYRDEAGHFAVRYYPDVWIVNKEPSGFYFSMSASGGVAFSPAYPKDGDFRDYALSHTGVDMLAITYGLNDDGKAIPLGDVVTAIGHPYPDYREYHVRVDGYDAIRIDSQYTMEKAHGSGVAYIGPHKPYILNEIFMNDPNGRGVVITYDHPKDERVPCSFDTLLPDFHFLH